MPRRPDAVGAPVERTLLQRVLFPPPKQRSPKQPRDDDKPLLGDRLRSAFLKPEDPAKTTAPEAPLSLDELAQLSKATNDKERLIGLIAAPISAAITFLVIDNLITNDPPQRLANGQLNTLHVSVSLYHEVMFVLLGLGALMMGLALARKRLFLGIAMALYGLAIFNLHYWGFGIPFIIGAAWLLVRAYRIQREYREVSGTSGGSYSSRSASSSRPRPNKRYTPPAPGRASRA